MVHVAVLSLAIDSSVSSVWSFGTYNCSHPTPVTDVLYSPVNVKSSVYIATRSLSWNTTPLGLIESFICTPDTVLVFHSHA